MLCLHPDLFGHEAPAEYLDKHYDLGFKDLLECGPLAVYRDFEEYSASGAIGDPPLASVGKGRVIIESVATEQATQFDGISERNWQSGVRFRGRSPVR
jgi:creatinine amidohydrolase